jgi:hypothetical protein
MNRGLTWTGYAAASAVLLAITADFASHADQREQPVIPAPAGFRQQVPGVGPVEFAFSGRVTFVTDERAEPGTVARATTWRVEGDDPRPEHSGAAISNAHIVAPSRQDQAEGPLTVDAPQAWIPLRRELGNLRLDMQRVWRLTDPVLELPGFALGRRLTATATGDAILDPALETVTCPGRFHLESHDLSLDAARFHYEARTRRLTFAPWKGDVRWTLRGADGRAFHGRSDGGGEVLPTADGGLMLRFDTGPRGVRATLPAAAGSPAAQIACRGLTANVFPRGDSGWEPRDALAVGPVFLTDARLAFEGGNAALLWAEDGALAEVALAGPAAVHPWDASFQVATARERATFDPARGALTLDGRCIAISERGFVSADGASWNGSLLQARGEVVASAAEGFARAAELDADADGNMTARGDVRVRPSAAQVDEIRGPAMSLRRDSLLEMSEGFHAAGRREGRPWSVAGQRIVSRVEPGGVRRTDADGALVYVADGVEVRAEKLRQLDDEEFRLEGPPGTARMELDEGGIAQATFRRAETDGDTLRIEGAPVFTLPAATLGLAGEDVRLEARSVTRESVSGAWLLDDDVRATGALQAQADRARWSPTEGLWLERRAGPPSASGTLADGRAFSAAAQRLGVTADEVLVLDGDAVARLAETDGRTHVLTAERTHIGADGGWAEGRARFDSPLGRGSAERADWRSTDGKLQYLKLTGGASLAVEQAKADGAIIELDDLSGWMSVTGDAAHAAHILTEDGREIRADSLRYNVRTMLLETGAVRFDSPRDAKQPGVPK